MKKKLQFISAIILCLFIQTTYCLAQGAWTQKANLPNVYGDESFSIGSKGYLLENDKLYEWNSVTNTWTQKASFPGIWRGYETVFSIGSKGYVCMGSSWVYFNDLWEYDPATDTWTQKADLPTNGKGSSSAFTIGNKGYIVAGDDGGASIPELWEWDQSTNSWTQKASFPNGFRFLGVAFSIGTKGYFGTGQTGSVAMKDFWEWDQPSNTWTQKADFAGGPRSSAVAFSVGTKGYIGTGKANNYYVVFKDLWEWDQSTNGWSQKASLPGVERADAIGFSINGKGYIGGGQYSDSITMSGYMTGDFYEFNPNTVTGMQGVKNIHNVNVFPNPASNNVSLAISNTGKSNFVVNIMNEMGQIIYSESKKECIGEYHSTVNLANQPRGIYLIEIKSDNERVVKKIALQ